MDVKGAVEAALFASADNLKLSDIAERTGFPEEEVRTAMMDLRREYEERDSAIVISKIGSEFRMMLRPEFNDYIGMFGKAEMSAGLMRTLSTIAYNQPVLQSELVRTRGPRGYDDVHRLIEMGFVSGRKSGQTLELTTTKRFSEYFGIGSTRKSDIRRWIESQATNRAQGEDGGDAAERRGQAATVVTPHCGPASRMRFTMARGHPIAVKPLNAPLALGRGTRKIIS